MTLVFTGADGATHRAEVPEGLARGEALALTFDTLVPEPDPDWRPMRVDVTATGPHGELKVQLPLP